MSPNGQLYGPRRRIHNLAIFLANKGHDVNVYCKTFYHASNRRHNANIFKIEVERIDGVTVNWVPSIVYKTNGFKRLISELQFSLLSFFHIIFLKRSSEVLIADSVTPINGFFGLLASKLSKLKFIHQIRDVWPIALVHDGALEEKSLAFKIFKYMETKQYKNCDWICSALPDVHEYIDKNGGNSSKITYVRNGIDMQNFNYIPYEPNEIINVTYLGTISNAHDVISIPLAAKLLKDEGKSNRFIFNIYGDGVKRKECEKYVAENKIENVCFHGTIPREKVALALSKADLLVSPVLNSKAYSFGLNLNKIYDYFAAGRPVMLCSPNKVNDITLANSGYSLPAEDPLMIYKALLDFLALSRKEKKELGNNAYTYAKKEFNIEILCHKFEKMILSLNENSS